MANSEDHAPSTASSESTPAAPDQTAAAADATAPAEAAAALEPDQSAQPAKANSAEPESAKPDSAKPDSAKPEKINLPAALVIDHAERISADDGEPVWSEPSGPKEPSWFSRHAALAAGITVALGLGAIAGAAATASFVHKPAAPAPVAASNTASPNKALQQSLARLETELAAVKAGIATTQRSVGTQFGKLTERIDRAEKAQAEPGQKLAKIIESLDRVEHKMPQPGVLPPPAARADITGSVAAKNESRADSRIEAKIDTKADIKTEAKPAVAEGWHLVDVYRGRAVVESRNGRLFEVGPGSNLPELGRVEGITRENGRVVVVTRNGIITAAAVARRRLPRFLYDD